MFPQQKLAAAETMNNNQYCSLMNFWMSLVPESTSNTNFCKSLEEEEGRYRLCHPIEPNLHQNWALAKIRYFLRHCATAPVSVAFVGMFSTAWANPMRKVVCIARIEGLQCDFWRSMDVATNEKFCITEELTAQVYPFVLYFKVFG